MIAIIDYGVGNLFSLCSSLYAIGEKAIITSDAELIKCADKLILPGVGAFRDAIQKLNDSGLIPLLKEEVEKGKPLLGICLGMQMLFDESYEYGKHEGLHFVKGSVVPMKGYIDNKLLVPHIGWNRLHFCKESKLFKYVNNGDYVYFVHSYFASDCADNVTATTDYGEMLTASVEYKNVYGCQFHPEKSGTVGLKILKAFCEVEQ